MKRLLPVSMMFLMLATMLHFSIATHYCCGNVVAIKVSLTTKLASCCVECEQKNSPVPEVRLISHCCDDVLAFCGVDSYYIPSFSFGTLSYQNDFRGSSIFGEHPICTIAVLKSLYTNVSPPGAMMSTNVNLSDICTFRI